MKVDTKSLDGFRFLLALWVCVGHFYIVIGGTNYFNIPLVSNIFLTPVNAVDGFMIITGFLMAYHYILNESKESPNKMITGIKFILRRIFRLYPVYLLVIIVAFFLVTEMYDIRKDVLTYFTGSSMTVWGTESKIEFPTITGLLTHLTLIHGLVPGHDSSVLSVAWSLSLEMQFYILFPLIFSSLFFTGNTKRILSVTILTVVLSVISLKGYNLLFDMPAALIFKFPLFLFGMLIAAVGLGKIKWNLFFLASLIIIPFESKLTILLAFMLLIFLFLDNIKPYINSKIFNILVMIRKVLSSKVAKLGANISYSLYLIHMITLPFILQFFMSLELPKYQTAIFSFVAFIVINFILSYTLYRTIETLFIRYGKEVVSKIGLNNSSNKNSKVLNEEVKM